MSHYSEVICSTPTKLCYESDIDYIKERLTINTDDDYQSNLKGKLNVLLVHVEHINIQLIKPNDYILYSGVIMQVTEELFKYMDGDGFMFVDRIIGISDNKLYPTIEQISDEFINKYIH